MKLTDLRNLDNKRAREKDRLRWSALTSRAHNMSVSSCLCIEIRNRPKEDDIRQSGRSGFVLWGKFYWRTKFKIYIELP